MYSRSLHVKIISFLLIPLIFPFTLLVSVLGAPVWNSAWMYGRSIMIDNSRSREDLRDYQVQVTLDTLSLISAGKMRPDCGDIRFIDSDGTTLLSYWIEPNTCNTHNTKIWIKIPLIPASATKTIYMYYGNPTATTTSDAGAVFTEGGTFFHTRYSTADPDSLTEALNAYSQAQDKNGYCYMWVPDYTYVSNDYDSPHWSRYYCPSGSGSSTDVAFWVEAVFYVDTPGVWEFRLGCDYGRGGGLYVDNVALDEKWTSDLWWDDDWNSPSVLKGSIKLDVGWHKLFTIGFEDCCEGGHTLQFKKPGGDWTAWSTSNLNIKSRKYIIPEPITSIGREEGKATTSQTLPPTLTLYDPQVNGLTVTINGNVAPGYSGVSISRIHWEWGDGSSGDSGFPASHTYGKPGTYNVTVTVYQSDGLTTSKTVTVTVQALNRPPVADFSYSPPSPLAGEAVSFTDKSYDPDGSIVYWHWDFGDGKTFDYAHPGSITYVYTSPGTYTVTLTVRDDKGAENSTSRIIQVKAQQAVSTPTETSTLVAIVLVVVAAIVALYLILKRRTPKPPPPPLLPPPPPPG